MNVYDFDGTIYRGDSTVDFFRFSLRRKPALARYLPAQAFGFALYALGRIDKTEMKARFFRFLRGMDAEEAAAAFWRTHREKIEPWYLQQKAADDLVISASPEFLLRPVCAELGVRLIASRVDPKTGRFDGLNCRGEEKVARLRAELGDVRIGKFYSDSESDLPLAKLAAEPYFIVRGNIERWKI